MGPPREVIGTVGRCVKYLGALQYDVPADLQITGVDVVALRCYLCLVLPVRQARRSIEAEIIAYPTCSDLRLAG